ncbi:RNase J family beta-CASP ribonuclease [Sneathiella chungangensis]|uniref:RNase J family beta-CASP ribonuclease n=1 Tax=Sneathiella chungangensis TaxID=1418234 RepID=A0A845MCE3_9PROT|nr:ribonuclease J [Sneathiella chungangensis]MZR21000.1 RNase J family beta-CASP ribonuclease [Sneathiella chungangensis]
MGNLDASLKNGLYFLPLGGSGEIGMNLNLYCCNGKWVMIDCGISFADDRAPGIDVIVPDPTWIAERRADLLAIIVTHAHEDHVGAVARLWPQFQCPVYTSPFTAEILALKLAEEGLENDVEVNVVAPGSSMAIGDFHIDFVDLTHSIPEMQALMITTPYGRVLHSGDWKLDPDPVVGPASNLVKMQRVSEQGVLAMICDSTNVFKAGVSGSELDVQDSLDVILGGIPTGRIAVTTFASNIARLMTIASVAERHDRHVVLVGRSLHRMTEAAKRSGYLNDLPPFIDEKDASHIPRDKILLLCTGSQGEARGAMARIARGEHAHIALDPGDTVIFSSKVIPGNEKTLYALHNQLTEKGIEVITEADEFVHVSGHPARGELTDMYGIVKPKIAIPVHGEARHIRAHCELARSLGVEQAIEITNGNILRLAPGDAEIIADVPSGRLAVDAGGLTPLDGEFLSTRRRLVFNGAVSGVVLVNEKGHITEDPIIRLRGVVDENLFPELQKELKAQIIERHNQLKKQEKLDDEKVEETAHNAVRRVFRRLAGRRPITDIYVIRFEEE